MVITSLRHLSPHGAGKQERSHAWSSGLVWWGLTGGKALLYGHDQGFKNHFCPMLEQDEKYIDIFESGEERLTDSRMAKRLVSGICTQNEHRLSGPLKQDVSAWGEVGCGPSPFPFLCCCLSCMAATTQGGLKRPHSRGLIAKTILQNIEFDAFFDEVGVGHRICCLQKAVLLYLLSKMSQSSYF